MCLLAAAVLASMLPGRALADETTGIQLTNVGQSADLVQSEDDSLTETAEPESAENGENVEDTEAEDTESPEDAAGDASGEDPGLQGSSVDSGKESGEEPGDQSDPSVPGEEEVPGGEEIPEIPKLIFPVTLPLTEGAEYEQLSTFLNLSADRFAIYTVVFVDMSQQPVQPDEAVEVALPIPSDYDMNRVVVSEISVEGSTPQRTELGFESRDGNAVFSTDHMGIYVVMEKTVYSELPGSLTPTDKVDRLELSKTVPAVLAMTPSAAGISTSGMQSAPLTGDTGISPVIWIVIMIAAVAAAVIVVIIKRK